MAPARALVYVENIRKALETLDPEGADGYRTRAAAYADRIRAVDAALQTTLSRIPAEQRWLVTSEGAFSYLTEAYGMRQAYLWPINADQQGTPQQVVKVVELVKKHRIPVVFSESTVSDKPARQVAADSGARYGGVLYVDSLTAADGPAPSYLQLLEANARTIERGFFPERP
jgi:manganese/iron transport system substrate-binding protein